jgi:putative transposase
VDLAHGTVNTNLFLHGDTSEEVIERKRVEKLRYMHGNPVTRGLVASPEDWTWSSFRHYATGEDGAVEIESQWTARKREQRGIYPNVHRRGSG